jgi:hypothetical protein
MDTYDKIAIAQIVLYSIFLAGAIYLALVHGFGRNAGWLYLVLFSLIRIVGSAFRVATLNSAAIWLFIGWNTLNSIGVSPLILILLGLLSRVLVNIRKSRPTQLNPHHLRLTQALVVVGLVLGIVGGVKTGLASVAAKATVEYKAESKVGLGLLVGGYALLCATTVIIGAQVKSADPAEWRIIPTVAASLAFVLVRLVYSCIRVYGDSGSDGSVGEYFGMSVLMELFVVLICEAVGFSLRKLRHGRFARSGARDHVDALPESKA